MSEIDFQTLVVQPWEELNFLLSKPLAFDPNMSMVMLKVNTIANEIKNQNDKHIIQTGEQNAYCTSRSAQLISDVADQSKHVRLRNQARHHKRYVAAMFEVNDQEQFRFLRNAVFIDHNTDGLFDFMDVAKDAIDFWRNKRSLKFSWSGEILENNQYYQKVAKLKFDPKFCMRMEKVRIKFFKRDREMKLFPCDPVNVYFELY